MTETAREKPQDRKRPREIETDRDKREKVGHKERIREHRGQDD